ncbi:SGNH/GDSL hydrolase family protein [Blastochloris tepida]|uniref:Uncharacterized protein n=1 Tax=Blastochloris tepida TaxID=2233851 RepID=A0A348G1Y7_9HYPH|nr:SGNH family hydrolase [Blastochloris tepida]BBF93570.1 hypothetical protein BLTE_22550 [Blastochloris tepida]
MVRGRIAVLVAWGLVACGLTAWGLTALVLAATPLAAQERDDRYFTLRDPFRTERSYVPRMRWSPPTNLDAPARQSKPLEPPSTEPQGTAYASATEADEARTSPALEYIAVFGDSLAEPLAKGLADSFVQDLPEVAVLNKARPDTSLIRKDPADWIAAAQEMLASDKVTVGVVVIGINERQAAQDETGATFEPRSERWVQAYTRRVDDLMALFKAKNIPLFWVGLPAMKSGRLSQDMQFYNEIIRERAARAGVPFVDVWDGFVDEQGQFVTSGPALDGQKRRLRNSDGIHFTRAGGRKLAHFVERDIRLLLDQRIPRAPAETNEQTPPPAAPSPDVPATAVTPQVPQPQPLARPVAGPVVPLVGATGPSGPLAGATPARSMQSSDPIVTQVLVRGETPPPVAGRADDFVWPGATATPAAATPTTATPAAATPAEPGKATP